MDEGDAGEAGDVVEEEPRGEVVQPVDDHVVSVDDRFRVVRLDAAVVCPHSDLVIPCLDEPRGALDLRFSHVGLAVDDLPLEVRTRDRPAIGDADRADTRGSEVLDRRRTETARTDHEHPGLEETQLPRFADLVEHELSGVAVRLAVVECVVLVKRVVPVECVVHVWILSPVQVTYLRLRR